jgi:hypothetical protein
LIHDMKFAPHVLIQPGDSPQYVQLLQGGVIGLPELAPEIPKDLELFVQKENHLSLLHGVVADLMNADNKTQLSDQRSKAGKNVLTLGLWKAKSVDVNAVEGMGSVECLWPNSALNIVRGLSWQKLHERVGTDLLRFMLREALVFSLLPNNCYLQLCGLSVVYLLKQRGNRRLTQKTQKKTIHKKTK